MQDETTTPTKRGRGRPPGAKNKRSGLSEHVTKVIQEVGIPNTPGNRTLVENRICFPDSHLAAQAMTGNRIRVTGQPRLLGKLATSQALWDARQEILPRIKMRAVEAAPTALRTLVGMMDGSITAPASVRRLAALDLLNIAGIPTNAATVEQTPGGKPVAEMTAEELRALLGQQRAALAKIDASLGEVVVGEEVDDE